MSGGEKALGGKWGKDLREEKGEKISGRDAGGGGKILGRKREKISERGGRISTGKGGKRS